MSKSSEDNSIFIAGHRGMVGGSLVRALRASGRKNIITANRDELDLVRQDAVEKFFEEKRPKEVIVAAAKVGGIHANATYPADFIYQNLMIAANIVRAAHITGTQRLLFLGSSCIYPRLASQPMQEDALLSGPLEKTNEAYAIAKIAGLKLCTHYRHQYGVLYHSAMPTNLYGPGDNYHPENSHVIPGMLRRFHEAKLRGDRAVVVWGTGTPLREFLHVDDLATACLHLLTLQNPPDLVNVGSGEEVTIRHLAEIIGKVVGFDGVISFDSAKPDGTPRKLMDSTLMRSQGWEPRIALQQGLATAYEDMIRQLAER
jgi:GDP-L-fucose synthase